MYSHSSYLILNEHKIIFEMIPRWKFSDKIDFPLYNGIFYIFGKLQGIVGDGKFQDIDKIFCIKSLILKLLISS